MLIFWFTESRESQNKEKRMCRTRTEGVAPGQDINIEGLSLKIPEVKPTSLGGIIKTNYSVEV
jgi:preprotein translocase subunit YajC